MSEKGLTGIRNRFRIGPGALITAAFIGPGTITTCSIAGARFGFALLWGLVFSVIATIVLQEMSARLGIITGQGLGEALRKHFHKGIPKLLTIVLVISAITIGNAAFETGNILGATLGLEALLANILPSNKLYVLLIGSVTFIVLFTGNYKVIEKAMIILVIMMSLTFLTTAIIVLPLNTELLHGLLVPSLPTGSLLTLLGLIGTTVVPYNLFLYAAAVHERFKHRSELSSARVDMMVSVIIGGLISIAIVTTAAVSFYGSGNSPDHAGHLALQLTPLLGNWAKLFIAAGLFAAGISSAITAPLAAAYATMGIMGWERNMRSTRFRAVWIIILLTGIVFSLMGLQPMEVILFAQAANGILLPVIAIYLLWIVNSKKIMGNDTNSLILNMLGVFVVLITIGLGLRSLLHVFEVI